MVNKWIIDVCEWMRCKCETCSVCDLYGDEQPRSRSVVLRTKFRHRMEDLLYTGSFSGISIGKHRDSIAKSGATWPSDVQHRVLCDSAIVKRLIIEIRNYMYNSSSALAWTTKVLLVNLLDWVVPSIKPMSCVMICPYCIASRVQISSLTSLFGNIV